MKNDILMFWRRFQCDFCMIHVSLARITITHACCIALTLPGSLRRCLNARSSVLMFKQLPWVSANVSLVHKNMCDAYK